MDDAGMVCESDYVYYCGGGRGRDIRTLEK